MVDGEWHLTYAAILREFGWDEGDDREAAHALHDRIAGDQWKHVGTELKHRTAVTVVGCGPQLDILLASDLPPGIVVAADGATSRLREMGIVPRIVVTDLDGDRDALLWAASQGSTFVVHAHGHNQERLPLVDRLGPFVAGTYQCTPDPRLDPMRNLQGFTDGDRAVRLREDYHVGTVSLVAFDFRSRPSRHSGTWDPATKPAKLAWAQRIIEGVAARGRTRVQVWDPKATTARA